MRNRIMLVISACLLGVVTSAALGTAPAFATVLPGTHQLVNKSWRNACLDVTNGDLGNGAAVGASQCANAPYQQWTTSINADGTRSLVNVNSAKCLAATVGQGGVISNGAQVIQQDCNPAATNQKWTIFDDTSGWSKLVQYDSGGNNMCIDKAGWNAVMWDCGNKDWQRWQSLG